MEMIKTAQWVLNMLTTKKQTREIVEVRGVWHAAVHEITESDMM